MKYLSIKQTRIAIIWLLILANIFSCKKNSTVTEESITGFSADTAWIGKTITINGSGFSRCNRKCVGKSEWHRKSKFQRTNHR